METGGSLGALLGAAGLAWLRSRGQRRHYAPGSTVFAEGAAGDSLLLIESGLVEMSVATRDGRRVVLGHLGPGETVGEMALLDQGPRSATVTAQIDVTGTLVGFADFRAFLLDRPEVLFALAVLLSRRLRAANAALEVQTQRDGPRRLAGCLLRLARTTGGPGADGRLCLGLRLSQSEIGALVGLERANVNRILRRWTAEGWIGMVDGRLCLLAPDRLEHLGED